MRPTAARDAARAEAAALAEEAQERQALGDIASAAQRVCEDLDLTIDRCENFAEYSDDVPKLKSISSVVRAVHGDLQRMDEAGTAFVLESRDMQAARAEKYDDPVLARARRFAALSTQFCEDLDHSSRFFGGDNQTLVEASALQEISSATRAVFQDMRQLQIESWAMRVLDTDGTGPRAAKTAVAEDLADLPTALSTAPPPEIQETHSTEGSRSEPQGGQNDSHHSVTDTTVSKVNIFEDVSEFLAQVEDDELSDAEIQRMQNAFKRFQVPDSNDVHKDDVTRLLSYLGFVLVDEAIVGPLIKEITTYDYFDFDEFLSLMSKFIPREKEEFLKVFKKYDEDGSGGIDARELKAMLMDLGMIPLHAMMQEALSIASANSGVEELNYSQFTCFLAVYRRYEGFASEEVADMRKIFEHHSNTGEPQPAGSPPQLSVDDLTDALVAAFGLQMSDIAEDLAEQMKAGSGLQKSAFSSGGNGKPEKLNFQEFLIFARKAREKAFDELCKNHADLSAGSRLSTAALGADADADAKATNDAAKLPCDFKSADTDGNGLISEAELRTALRKYGYTPLQKAIDEFMVLVGKENNRQLEFSEFFNFMLLWNGSEGFRKHAVDEFRAIFNSFDDDGSGEISSLELAELFRELGYKLSLVEIQGFVLQVDKNASNQLDFREFLKLMRLHRESELHAMNTAFDVARQGKPSFPGSMLEQVLTHLRHRMPSCGVSSKEEIDLDRLVYYVDICRAEYVAREKKKSGFSDERIDEFQDMFNRYDTDRGGDIDSSELMPILREFDLEPKSREEQQALVKRLEVARTKAREAGVAGGMKDTDPINFWTFVQLMRVLETEKDHAEERHMNLLMEELNFKQKEVEEFRQIFAEKKKTSVPEGEEEPVGLPRQAVKRLIFMLGVEIKGERKVLLEDELMLLGCTEEDPLDFECFLRLMRWLMETGWLPK